MRELRYNMVEWIALPNGMGVVYRTQQTDYERMADRIFVDLWGDEIARRNPVLDAFRDALVTCAMSICHETGDEESFVRFCADTIRDFLHSEAIDEDVRQQEEMYAAQDAP